MATVNRVAELIEKREKVLAQVASLNEELLKELHIGGVTATTTSAPKKGKKRGRPKGSGRSAPAPTAAPADATAAATATAPAPAAPTDNGERSTSMPKVVKKILDESPDGLELKQIVEKVQVLKDKGEVHSKAKKLTSVVSQALDKLKKDNLIQRNRDTRKYSSVAA